LAPGLDYQTLVIHQLGLELCLTAQQWAWDAARQRPSTASTTCWSLELCLTAQQWARHNLELAEPLEGPQQWRLQGISISNWAWNRAWNCLTAAVGAAVGLVGQKIVAWSPQGVCGLRICLTKI